MYILLVNVISTCLYKVSIKHFITNNFCCMSESNVLGTLMNMARKNESYMIISDLS